MKNELIQAGNDASKLLNQKSPLILTVLGLVGMYAGIVMVAKVSPKAKDIVDDLEESRSEEMTKSQEIVEDVKAVAPLYLPAALTIGLSTACLIGSYKISADRIAILGSAYTITEAKLNEYQKKVIDTIGEKKEQEIQDSIAKDHMDQTQDDQPNNVDDLLMDGKQLFFDDFSKRYFRCSYQDLYRAKEELNLELAGGTPCEINRWYELIDDDNLEPLDDSVGEVFGWFAGEKVEYRTVPHLCKDGLTTCTGIILDAHMCAEEWCRTY